MNEEQIRALPLPPLSMLTPKQIADKYNMPYCFTLHLAKTGKVAAIRTGNGKRGKILINETSFIDYLNSAYLTDDSLPDNCSEVKGIRVLGGVNRG